MPRLAPTEVCPGQSPNLSSSAKFPKVPFVSQRVGVQVPHGVQKGPLTSGTAVGGPSSRRGCSQVCSHSESEWPLTGNTSPFLVAVRHLLPTAARVGCQASGNACVRSRGADSHGALEPACEVSRRRQVSRGTPRPSSSVGLRCVESLGAISDRAGSGETEHISAARVVPLALSRSARRRGRGPGRRRSSHPR
jgi:hypothetical protein